MHRIPTSRFVPFLLLAAFFYLLSCSFEKPRAPSWDVDVTIPLMSKVFTMTEIAEDESSLSIDSTGMLTLEVEAELDDYYVGDQLTIAHIQDRFSLDIGSFDIDSPGSEFTSVQLREIFSEADNFHGQAVVVPEFSFATNKKQLDPYEDFSYVVIDSGNITLQVTNNLVVPLGSPLTLEIWDAVMDTLIVSETVQRQILPNDNAFFLVDLAGRKMPNRMAIRMLGDSPGSGGNPVVVDAGSIFEVEAIVSAMLSSEALASVPAHLVTDQDDVAITDSLVIVYSKIEVGVIDLVIASNLPLDTWIRYEMPDLIAPNGRALVDSFFVASQTNTAISIRLDNYSLRPQRISVNKPFDFCGTARTIDTGAQMVLRAPAIGYRWRQTWNRG